MNKLAPDTALLCPLQLYLEDLSQVPTVNNALAADAAAADAAGYE